MAATKAKGLSGCLRTVHYYNTLYMEGKEPFSPIEIFFLSSLVAVAMSKEVNDVLSQRPQKEVEREGDERRRAIDSSLLLSFFLRNSPIQ